MTSESHKPARQSSGKRPVVAASAVLDALARDLMQIKNEDRLTFADLGRVIGRSEDQAAKYCEGTAEMGVTAFYFAKQAWNGRFTGRADALVSGDPDATCDRAKESKLLKAALALSVALEDGEVDDEEIRANRKTLEHARDAVEALLSRVGPKGRAA